MAQEHDEYQIFVKSRPRRVPGPSISFEDVLRLAGIDITGQDPTLFDVEWTHGNKTGTLEPGQSVPLQNGMRFDAGKSNRS